MCKDYADSFMWDCAVSECVEDPLGGVCAVSLMCIAFEFPNGSLEARWSLGAEPNTNLQNVQMCHLLIA